MELKKQIKTFSYNDKIIFVIRWLYELKIRRAENTYFNFLLFMRIVRYIREWELGNVKLIINELKECEPSLLKNRHHYRDHADKVIKKYINRKT